MRTSWTSPWIPRLSSGRSDGLWLIAESACGLILMGDLQPVPENAEKRSARQW